MTPICALAKLPPLPARGDTRESKHPPAKPGALFCEPLKAAGKARDPSPDLVPRPPSPLGEGKTFCAQERTLNKAHPLRGERVVVLLPRPRSPQPVPSPGG